MCDYFTEEVTFQQDLKDGLEFPREKRISGKRNCTNKSLETEKQTGQYPAWLGRRIELSF